jgi:glycosyltransferase involved in cell wall biosynthesis
MRRRSFFYTGAKQFIRKTAMPAHRFLFAIHNLGYTGAVFGMLEFARHLIAEGHSVDLAATGDIRQGMAERVADSGVGLVGADAMDANARGYAVAYVCTILASRIAARLSETMPVVWHLHEAEIGLRILLDDPFIATVFGKAAHIIVPHDHCRDTVYRPFIAPLPSQRISVINSGIDHDPSQPRGQAVDKDPSTILFVGSLYPRKRPGDLVRAVLEFLPETVHCRFVGDTDGMSDELKAEIAKAPQRFDIAGGVLPEAMAAEYRRSAILCLPSSDEASPRALLEGGYHECAPVISDLPVYRGIWRHGRDSLTYPVSNVESLGMMLKLLIQEPGYRIKLAQSAAATALRHSKRAALARKQLILEELAAYR